MIQGDRYAWIFGSEKTRDRKKSSEGERACSTGHYARLYSATCLYLQRDSFWQQHPRKWQYEFKCHGLESSVPFSLASRDM